MASHSAAEGKAFILSHMNEDHADSLALYLRHYAKVPAAPAYTARMEDITTRDMTISYVSGPKGARTHTAVKFEPPLASLSEAHIRLVQMSYAGSAAVGESPFRVRKFTWPTLAGWTSVIGVVFGVYTLLTPSLLARDGLVTLTLFRGSTTIPALLREWRLPLLGAMAAIHATEAASMYRLAWKHCPRRINIFSQEAMGWVGWKWILSCFVEGAWAFSRIQALIDQEKAKHKQS